MKKMTLFIGLNDKDSLVQSVSDELAMQAVMDNLMPFTDGMTVYNAKGMYTHADGSIVIENSLRIEIFGSVRKGFSDALMRIKSVLNQESIIVEVDSDCKTYAV